MSHWPLIPFQETNSIESLSQNMLYTREFSNKNNDNNMQVVQQMIAGDIFGEIGVLCDTPQPFTVRTTELSQILRLNRASLTNIMQANKADSHIVMSNLFLVRLLFEKMCRFIKLDLVRTKEFQFACFLCLRRNLNL